MYYLSQTWTYNETTSYFPLYYDPGSYRPVSMISVLSKLFERIKYNRLQGDTFTHFPNRQQQGFQNGLSYITAAFNLQETLYHKLEQRSNVYVAQLDIKGAFDAVWIDGLFFKLQQLGIVQCIWRVLRNSNCGLKTIVRVGSSTSRQRSSMRGPIRFPVLCLHKWSIE